MLVGQGDQLLQCFQRYQRTGRVAWRAEEEDLTALPDFRGHGVEIRVEAVLFEARQVVRRGSGEQRCAFIDLIERIGADHQPIGVAIDHGLGEGEQCFACPVHRQDMARRVQRLGSQAETPFAPTRDGFAQRRNAERGRIDRELVEVVRQRLGDEIRRTMLGLADRQGDGALVRRRLDAGKQRAQFLERVGMQQIQGVVHECCSFRVSAANAPHSLFQSSRPPP